MVKEAQKHSITFLECIGGTNANQLQEVYPSIFQ